MPWINEVWVGKHESRGIIAVGRQEKRDDDSVAVYFADQNRVAICKRSFMRDRVSDTSVSDAEVLNAIQGYTALAEQIGVDLADTTLILEHQKFQKQHQEFLNRLGRGESSVRRSTMIQKVRSTHCYSCKKALNSTVDWECTACNWILCTCGACGCGYSRY